jgi:hypothetical protein
MKRTSSTSVRSLITAAFAAASLFTAGAASADTLRYDGAWFGSYFGAYNIRDTLPSAVNINVSAGAFRMTDTSGPTVPAGTSFMAWCVDIRHLLNTGSSSYSLEDGAAFLGGLVAARLERLASYVVAADGNAATTTLQSTLTGSQQSAAFQLAVWEVVNEGSASSYNVNSGDFYVSSGDASVRTLANNWLNGAMSWAGTTTQSLNVWAGPNSTQDLGVFAPIPEPETYAMLLAGLGLMGFVARRRRRI